MKYKKIMLILITAVFLVSIAGVCAADANDTMVASEDANQIEVSSNDVIVEDNVQTGEENNTLTQANDDGTVSAESGSQILGEGEGNYSDLRTDIENGGNLTKSYYKYQNNDGGTIIITTPMTINGNGAVIDMEGSNIRAFYVSASDVTIKNLTIINANFGDNGGAVYFVQSGMVINCNFTNNTAISGGAVYFYTSGMAINCNFMNNQVMGIYSSGGAIMVGHGTIENCTFTNNSADYEGGAIRMDYGNVTNCNFVNNTQKATIGGGAICYWNSGFVTNCNFTNNAASGDGGAICFRGKGNATNCNFINNSASNRGGAIYFSSTGPRHSVTNCNFTGNIATIGSAICFYSSSSTKIVSNSIFLNNRANAEALNVVKKDNNITITFTGKNNLLNAIYSRNDAEVTFTNVTYWGAKGITNTGDLTVKPSRSNKQAGQNITIAVVVNDKLVFNDVRVTNENGTIVLNLKIDGSYYIGVCHDEDSYYTEAENITSNMKFYANVTSQTTTNRTVNITAKSNIKPEVMPGKLLFILPNGDVINATYAVDGIWWAVHTFDDYTDYQVDASYIGLSNVTINNATISITRTNSTVNVSDVVLDYGEARNVTVTAEGATGITAKINDTNVTVVNNFTIPISGLNAGNYTLTVTTIPDGDHNPVTKTVNITVNKAGTEITLTNETLYLKAGDIVSDLANLTPGDAGNLTFQSSNDDIAIAADGTILARVKGNVTVTVSFAGTDNYAAAENKTITVYIALKDAGVSVENETLNLNVNEKYEFNPTVNPSFLAVQYSSSNESVVTVTDYGLVCAVGEGTAIITLAVGNNQTYAINTTNVTVTVSLNDASVSLNNSTLDLFVGDTFTIVATTIPAGLNVTYVQDDSGVYTVDSNGVVTALKTGTGNILVKVGGDGVYAENSTEIPVTVSKAPTEIVADSIAAVYNVNKDLVITLKDSRGKPVSGLNITVDLNGARNYTTDTSGQVKISTKGLAVNTYEVLISFNGTENYVNCSKTTKVSIYKETSIVDAKPLTTVYNVHKYLVVGLKDKEGNPIRNADTYMEINGVTYKCRSDNNGNARLIIRLNPNKYSAKITFDNVNYTGFTQYVTVIVKKATPKLTAKKKTFKKSKKVKKYTVTLKANSKALAKVKLTLKVKGKTYKAKTNAKGKAVFKIKNLKKKGTFKAKVKFAGNTYYNAVTKTVKIKIK